MTLFAWVILLDLEALSGGQEILPSAMKEVCMIAVHISAALCCKMEMHYSIVRDWDMWSVKV